MICVSDQTQKGIPLSIMMIRAKPKFVCVVVKEKAGPDYNVKFTPSTGSFK
jgi:hypothetical protein